MTPEDVCASLAHPHRPPPPAPGDLPPDKADDILANISASYFMLRRGMALIALAFPVVLWIVGGADSVRGSLSAYYHSDGGGLTRDVFVGVLWAIGAFLLLYRGYSTKEDWALNGAGLAAVAVALAPMDWPPGARDTTVGLIHNAAAITFFLLIAYVPLFRSGDTLALMRDEARAAAFRRAYRLLGLLMVLLPLTVVGVHLLLPRREGPPLLFFVEAAGVYVFAAFWLVKSREIAVLERQ